MAYDVFFKYITILSDYLKSVVFNLYEICMKTDVRWKKALIIHKSRCYRAEYEYVYLSNTEWTTHILHNCLSFENMYRYLNAPLTKNYTIHPKIILIEYPSFSATAREDWCPVRTGATLPWKSIDFLKFPSNILERDLMCATALRLVQKSNLFF